ncbi:MAG: preprotein translocase subunit SecA [bacterium]
MIQKIFTKIVGSKNDRELKRLQRYVDEINSLEPHISKLSDKELQAKTGEFKNKYHAHMDAVFASEGIDKDYAKKLNPIVLEEKIELERIENIIRKEEDSILGEMLYEAFAVVRETGKRVLNMRHFDVQLMGGVVLHEGKIAEMTTGEGKTLVATLPVYLNALTGKGVHVVTVNDYLAKRDSEWMGQVYTFLGLTVGLIQHDMRDDDRKKAYQSDITYGTNNEFGFDYLRDNMKFRLEDYVQRQHNYAIVDEVDSILIDEARTPLIISGESDVKDTDCYQKAYQVVRHLKRGRDPVSDDDHEEDGDYQCDEEKQTLSLTEEGMRKAEKFLGISNLYEEEHEGEINAQNFEYIHAVNQALRAKEFFARDVNYVVKDGEVVIVDEFTGRLMPGRRYSDGLHQALEAKERVKVEKENQTLASITFQNYFRLYNKLAGMTGTADTEAPEFHKIYNLDVIVIPTNRPLLRHNYPDVIYRNEHAKFNAVVKEIEGLYAEKRPVLVGTIAIEKSEMLHELLKKKGIPHNVLNAKHHEKEAVIIAEAGQPGTVTIATNMAGRGTDIVLGAGIPEKGGLHILGTERHESRRIDNQLRGRSGRQGDPGSSRFYLSLEDDLLRIFGGDRVGKLMSFLKLEDDQPIEHKMVTKAIEEAQKKVEAQHFEARKHLLEYDDVMNKQREVIYQQRKMVLESDSLKPLVLEMIEDSVDDIIELYQEKDSFVSDWDPASLKNMQTELANRFLINFDFHNDEVKNLKAEPLVEKLTHMILQHYEEKEKAITPEKMRHVEKMITLSTIDKLWKEHLLSMDHLKEGIGMRGYGQKDPLIEYKKEGFAMFQAMIAQIKLDTVSHIFHVQKVAEEEERERARRENVRRQLDAAARAQGEGRPKGVTVKKEKKVGRNEPCPCGSGKKYKKCCGQ